jgi:MFS family permease
LIGTAGTALGFVGCGWIITYLRDERHFGPIEAYRIIFFVYAVVGIVKLCLALLLSEACELDPKPKPAGATETAPLLGNGATPPPKSDDDETKKRRWRLLPDISKESQFVLVQLCILFAFDNLASGLAPL